MLPSLRGRGQAPKFKKIVANNHVHFLRTGGGPPGVLFYKKNIMIFL